MVGAFGIRGELRIHLHNRSSPLLHQGGEVILVGPDGQRRSVHMKTRPGSGGRVLARVGGVSDRDAAEALIGHAIEGSEELLPPLDEGEYYHRDLIGLQVLRGEEVLGHLIEIHGHGSVDVWTVQGAEGEIFVPATREHVLEVDLEAGIIRVSEEAACGSIS